MANAQLPLVYVDLAGELEDGDISGAFSLFNRVPEPNETDVPENTPIEIMAADLAVVGLTAGIITIESSVGTIVAWTLAGGWHANYTGSVYNTSTSPGAGGADIHRWQLIRVTPALWTSESRVNVRIQLTPASGTALDATYSFYIEDLTKPRIVSAETRGLKTIRVTFSEAVAMHGDVNGALRVRSVSGRFSFTSPATIDIEDPRLLDDAEGDFLCFTGAVNALNNDSFEIDTVTRLDNEPTQVTVVEQTIKTEVPDLDHRGYIGPYRLQPILEATRLLPTFTPCIIGARQVNDRTVELLTDQVLSPNRPYHLLAIHVADATDPENVGDLSSVVFTAEDCRKPGRDFDLWRMIPLINRQEDTSHDLERFIRCFDEVTQILLYDVDRFEEIVDVDLADAQFLDALLLSLGNPYTFLSTDLEKRKAITHLVQTYKDSGTERSIEDVVFRILGIVINVFPLNMTESAWVLGESDLGVDTYLGTSEQALRYSFEIVVSSIVDHIATGTTTSQVKFLVGGLEPNAYVGRTLRIGNIDRTIVGNTATIISVAPPYVEAPPVGGTVTILGVLSETERAIITEIANTWKPAHTHFVRFVESGSIIPTF